VAYSASKSALYNLTRYLATYWAPRGVRVNTLTLAGVSDSQDENFLKGYLGHMPLGRMATADDYFGPVVLLLSEASKYMTGSDLVVDGGWTAW
jgi:NAD(P)-dependent dehydrogenase (short-subunit alcohol dehydrogenase family)